ncbi:hypothetical protein ACHQM5_004189 [Ranunculus cassubicifolius]
MTKSLASIAILVAFLLSLSTFEKRIPVAADECAALSGTWVGHCDNSDLCDKQCRELENYDYGSCDWAYFFVQCMCYNNC